MTEQDKSFLIAVAVWVVVIAALILAVWVVPLSDAERCDIVRGASR